MMQQILIYSLLLPIFLFYISAFLGSRKNNVEVVKNYATYASLLSILTTSIGGVLLFVYGPSTSKLIGIENLGFSLRLDPLTTLMFGMVSIIALFVLRFSTNYLNGDVKHTRFLTMFSIIVGSVQLLIISGNLFLFFLCWVITSIALQKLLTLYPDRKKAIQASKTKFAVARLGDLTLLSAFSLLYFEFGTGNIAQIIHADTLNSSSHPLLGVITILLVLTAILKSVQFPFHTWLLGVLESPTPVSALLHAGLLNAGPFLIIRFSNLFADSTVASTTLIIVGAISALFGSIVYITQTSVKTGLVYSSIGHMGFSLLLCGMGMFSAALLHLVSHSFYKAYSFLNSGNTINEMKAVNKNNYQRTGNPFKIIVAIAISFGVFSAFQYLLVQYFNLESQISFVGFVILIGIMGLYINAMDAKNYFRTILSIIGLSVFLLLSFFLFEELIRKLIQSEIPAETILHPVNQIIAIIILIVFMITVMFQSIITIPGHSNFATALRVHIKNGFYIESFVNRLSRKSNNPAHTGLKTKNLN